MPEKLYFSRDTKSFSLDTKLRGSTFSFPLTNRIKKNHFLRFVVHLHLHLHHIQLQVQNIISLLHVFVSCYYTFYLRSEGISFHHHQRLKWNRGTSDGTQRMEIKKKSWISLRKQRLIKGCEVISWHSGDKKKVIGVRRWRVLNKWWRV